MRTGGRCKSLERRRAVTCVQILTVLSVILLHGLNKDGSS